MPPRGVGTSAPGAREAQAYGAGRGSGPKTLGTEARADNLASGYTGKADDGSLSGSEREAAMLFSVAETHLNEGDPEQALSAAEEALALFEELGDRKGIADTTRIAVNALRLKADARRYNEGLGDSDVAVNTLAVAEQRAKDALERFRSAGDERGEAGMLLCQSEMHLDKKTYKACNEALAQALKAKQIYQKLGDRKMEGTSNLTLAPIYCRLRQHAESLEVSKDALEIFQEVSDRQGEAKALHCCAAARQLDDAFDDSIRYAKEALVVCKERGDEFSAAFEEYSIADLLAKEHRYEEALPLAKDALQGFRSLSMQNGWQSIVVGLIAKCLVMTCQQAEAVRQSEAALQSFRDKGDERQAIFVHDVLAMLHMGSQDLDSALAVTKNGISACITLQDRRSQASLLLTLASVHVKRKDYSQAWSAMESSIEIYRDQKESREEGLAWYSFGVLRLQAGEATEAEEAANKARALFAAEEEVSLEASTCLMVSQSHGVRKDPHKAVESAMEAHKLFGSAGDLMGQADAFTLVTDICMACEDWREAMRATKRRIKILENHGDVREHAKALRKKAEVHIHNEEPKHAVEAAMDAQEKSRSHGDRRGEVEALIQQTQAHVLGSWVMHKRLTETDPDKKPGLMPGIDKGHRCVREALDIAKRIPAKELVVACLFWTAQMQVLSKDCEQAIRTANDAIAAFQELRDSSGEAQALLLIGMAHRGLGANSTAEEFGKRGLAMFKEVDDESGMQYAKTFLQELKGGPAPAPVKPAEAGTSGVAEEAPKGPDPMVIRATLKETVSQLLGSDDDIQDDIPLMEGGLDSLSAVQFRNDAVKQLGVSLPASLTFDYPSITALVAHIVEISTP